MNSVQRAAMAYSRADKFLRELKQHQHELTPQQFKTLKGQAVSGDLDGAVKGLARVLKEKTV